MLPDAKGVVDRGLGAPANLAERPLPGADLARQRLDDVQRAVGIVEKIVVPKPVHPVILLLKAIVSDVPEPVATT